MAEKKTDEPAFKTVEISGRAWKVADEALNDFELLSDLGRLDDGEIGRLPSLMRRLLGVAQTQEALEALRDPESGRVPVTAGRTFVLELLDGLSPN